jgi:hypothetical protein
MRALVQNWKERRVSSIRPFLLGELLIVFILLRVYDYVKSLENVRMAASLHNGRDILQIERAVHVDVESGANHWLSHHHTLDTLLVWWYQYSHISGTMAVLACCYLWFPQLYRSARNTLVLSNSVAMLVFVVLPVMPPRLLPHAGFVDSVALAGFGTSHGGPIQPAQFAAMPSLHLAWATWVAVVSFTMLKGVSHRGLVFLYPVVTTISVISTGNHYVLDVIAGVAVAVGSFAACGFFRFARVPILELPSAEPVPVFEAPT